MQNVGSRVGVVVVEITASHPRAGTIGTTMENLKAAAAGENEEWTDWSHY